MSRPKVLVITPVRHIGGVSEILESIGEVTYLDDPNFSEVTDIIESYDVIFTNPNKSKIYIGKDIIDLGANLKVICTASTGTTHIDVSYAKKKGMAVLSLAEEREVIEKISSTAEHALALTLSALRQISPAYQHVLGGGWDYTKFIGRQFNQLIVGVIGYGRLGRKYSNYCNAMGAKVLVFDPFKKIRENSIHQVSEVEEIYRHSDIISVHVHVNDETTKMISNNAFNLMKEDVLLVNTARGEVIDEIAAVEFLRKNPKAKLAVDVVADEQRNRESSPLIGYARLSAQVLITPHIGGMSKEAQRIAYQHAAKMLHEFLNREYPNLNFGLTVPDIVPNLDWDSKNITQ